MIKAELVGEVAAATGYTRRETLEILETAMEVIQNKMAEGENVYLRGFGTFQVKTRKEKIARNITAKTSVVVPEHQIPAFKPAKDFINKFK